ncbi:Receptor-interacting serine/threonine-protein kinase 1 [Linnemannia zychae]|nr:Receptor-interacting serine/threonine-protein kinase 1 [Linnemannia zychae]
MAHMQQSSTSKSPGSSSADIPAPVPMKPIGGTSWYGSRPNSENTPASPKATAAPNILSLRVKAPSPMASTTASKSATLKTTSSPSASPSPKSQSQPSGFKIRVPRDLPGVPDIFRLPEYARSQSSASPGSNGSNSSTPDSPASPLNSHQATVAAESSVQSKAISAIQPAEKSKRTHSEMLSKETIPLKNFPIFDSYWKSGKKLKVQHSEPRSTGAAISDSPISKMHPKSSPSHNKSGGTLPSPKKSPIKRHSAKDASLPMPPQLPHIKLTFSAISAVPVTQGVALKQEDTGTTVPSAPSLERYRRRSPTISSSPAPSPPPTIVRFPTPVSINGGACGGFTDTIPTSSPPSSPGDVTLSQPEISTSTSLTPSSVCPSMQPLADTSSSPTSMSTSGDGSSASPISNNADGSRPAQLQKNQAITGSSSDSHVTNSPPPPPTSIADAIEQNIRTNETLQLVRLGMSILDRLLSNPVTKSFVNKVPLTLTNYYSVIKHPMDLTKIEQSLWKAFVVQQQSLRQPMNPTLLSTADHITFTKGYTKQAEFEHDLWQIYQNAIMFNPPSDIIHKDAASFQILYNGLLTAHRDGMLPIPRMPQELYHPSLVPLGKPGPLYLFRAQTFREMERKLTDVSADLFACFHQPLFDAMNSPEPISPDRPRFARMYITKNRTVLSACRDDPHACLAILSNMRVSKPFNDPEGGSNPTKVVHVKARVMIGKPIGERHDMITVGDLDCPSAWIIFAGVKTLDLDANIPVRFEKRVLSRLRHDVTPFIDTKLTVEQERAFKKAIGVLPSSTDFNQSTLSEYTDESMQSQVLSNLTAVSIQPTTLSQSKTSAIQSLVSIPIYPAPLEPASVGSTIEDVKVEVLPSLPSPIILLPTPTSTTTIAQSNTVSSAPTIALQRSRSQELKRPLEDSASENSTSATDSQHITKRRPSLVANEQIYTTAASNQTETKSGPSRHLVQLEYPPRHSPISIPTSVQLTSNIVPASIESPMSLHTSTVVIPSKTFEPKSDTVVSVTIEKLPCIESMPADTAVSTTTTSAASVSDYGQNNEFGYSKMLTTGPGTSRALTEREEQMLRDIKVIAREKHVPYTSWTAIEPTLIAVSAHGLFKRIYHVRGEDGLVVQNFKEMDAESFEQRVREVACLLKLRGLEGVGQIQSIIDDNEDHLVGLSMTKYAHTLKAYATNARRHPSPCQKLSLIRDMVAALCSIHGAGMAHRDLSEVNIMVDEDPLLKLEDNTPRPWVRVIDFGKSVFVEPEEVKRWSMKDHISDEELALLPLVVLPPDHGYKLYRSILTLPRSKHDHSPLPPCDPRAEDVYSLGVLIWRTFSGKSPWNGAIEDDIKTIRYLISSDEQIKFQLEREVAGRRSRELLLRCLTAEASTRSTIHELREWLEQPDILDELLREFETLGGGRKKVRKNLD